MDDEVHDDEPPGGGGVLAEGVPAVDEDGDVMIPAVSSRHICLLQLSIHTSGGISASVS